MHRTTSIALAALFVTALAPACARHNDGASTTTVTSGSTQGVRVTGARVQDAASVRLADEVCARESACNHIGDGARYRTEEACMADQGALAPVQVGRWSCTPTQTEAGFESCLAAIRSERCETTLTRIDQLVACRSEPVCGR